MALLQFLQPSAYVALPMCVSKAKRGPGRSPPPQERQFHNVPYLRSK